MLLLAANERMLGGGGVDGGAFNSLLPAPSILQTRVSLHRHVVS
jgi:O-acetyl-ADP-ribose deacetylase (regulator of RNase III)